MSEYRLRRLSLSEGHPIVWNLEFGIWNFPDKFSPFWFRHVRAVAAQINYKELEVNRKKKNGRIQGFVKVEFRMYGRPQRVAPTSSRRGRSPCLPENVTF